MLLCSSIFEHETAASMSTILKHYVVPVVSPHTHFRAVSYRKPRELFYIRFTGKYDSFQQSLCRTLQNKLAFR